MSVQTAEAKPPSKAPITELVIVRGIVCLGVVLMHSLPRTYAEAQLLLTFCTPTFVFLSAAIIGYAYDAPPKGFIARRARYVLLPFVVMSVVYAGFYSLAYLGQYSDARAVATDILRQSVANLAGGNHLWFIIPIFQFYLLYALCGPWLARLRAAVVLPVALLFNLLYLGAFDIPPFDTTLHALTDRKTWGLWFPAWVFYFVYGFWMGRNFQLFRSLDLRYVVGCASGAAAAGFLMLYLYSNSLLMDISSRRADVLIYTASLIPVLIFVASRVRLGELLLVPVSRYSFGIYILHPMFILFARRLLRLTTFVPVALQPWAMWVFAATGAFGMAYLLNRTPVGWILIGRPMRDLTTRADPTVSIAGLEALAPEAPPPAPLRGVAG